jgi:transposase
MNRDQFWLTDAQFSKIEPHLPTDTRGKARVDDRRVISGIIHVLKSGGRWVDAPPDYGPRKTLYNRFVRRAEKGVWVELFHALAQAGGPPAQVLIDSSAVKAHRSTAGGKEGRRTSGQKHDLSPPDMLLWRVAVLDEALKPTDIARRNGERFSCAHRADSHIPQAPGIQCGTQMGPVATCVGIG